jgi:hypothetical protein
VTATAARYGRTFHQTRPTGEADFSAGVSVRAGAGVAGIASAAGAVGAAGDGDE